jgi:Fe(II)/alpha-ketoglutarate-dependent arginine beta-hydroxylase
MPATDLVRKSPLGPPLMSLTPAERAAIGELADQILDEDPGILPEFKLPRIGVVAHAIPERIRTVLTEFRIDGEPYGGFVISGLPIDDSRAGATPTGYQQEPQGREAQRAEAILILIGSVLGDPFSYLTQQRGRMVLDVFPVPGHEGSQLGSSSTTLLEWHTEDAFHPCRADWIMLICIRNRERVATMFGPVQELDLTPRTRELLFQERFIIKPDESHTAEFNATTTGYEQDPLVVEAFRRVREMNLRPQRVSVLSGDRRAPYVRIDPAFMERKFGDEPAEGALDEIIRQFDARIHDVVLGPGELLIIDNLRAVHGRRPFAARYDGTDRWLRRVNITADLRKSADRRFGTHGRAVI